MDQKHENALDTLLEDEVRRGHRVKQLPEKLQAQLKADELPVFEHVRFTRLNPIRRRKIVEQAARKYQEDLQNPKILSHDQILELVERRGEWNKAKDERRVDLRRRLQRMVAELYYDGVTENDWTEELKTLAEQFRAGVAASAGSDDDKASYLQRFERWLEYMPQLQAEYTERFAGEQGRAEYSFDVDHAQLLDRLPSLEAGAWLEKMDELRGKLIKYFEMKREERELEDLNLKYAKIFSDSAEQRRDNTEELARIYYTVERCNADGVPAGALFPAFDDMWNLPEDVLQWLMQEHFYFVAGVPDLARELLEEATPGFPKAAGAPDSSPEAADTMVAKPSAAPSATSAASASGPSAASPEAPTSKPDSPSVAATASGSSAPSVATT